jgi:hypothetical protein
MDLFSKEDLQMDKYTKICSISLIIREMEFKVTVRYHFGQVRMNIIKEKQMLEKIWK